MLVTAKELGQGHPYQVWHSIQMIPELLSLCLEGQVYNQVEHVAGEMASRNTQRIFLCGTGSSYFASAAEKFGFDAIARIPAWPSLTRLFMAYPPLNLDSRCAVFFHSHSGNTEGDPEVVRFAKRSGAYAVGVTDIPSSELAREVADVLIGPGGPKPEKPATRTYATALFRMLLLATALGRMNGHQDTAAEYEDDLRMLPSLIRQFMGPFEETAQSIVDETQGCSAFAFVAYGPNHSTADEAAMAFNQSSGIPSTGYELDNFIHGPIQALNEGMGVFIIAAPGPLQERAFALARACKVIGATVVLLSPEGQANAPTRLDRSIHLPATLPLTSPIAYMVPLWQTAYYFGLLGRGGHPDRLSMDKPEFVEAFRCLMSKDQWLGRESAP